MQRIFGTLTGVLTAFVLTGLLALPAAAAQQRPDLAKTVGDRSPIFAVATSQGTLADYDRDYSGKHHLVMTFVPAAFTPV